MIVLRIDVRGHSADVRWASATAVLGSGADAAIARDDAGWAPREAMLVHLGDAVLVVRADGSGETRLRPGESVDLGGARVTLVGLAPLATGEAVAPSPPPAWTPALVDDPPRPTPARASSGAPRASGGATRAVAAGRDPPGAKAGAPPPPRAAAATARKGAPKATTAAPGPKPVVSAFGSELFAALKQSPWFAISAAVHALAFGLLMALAPGIVAPDAGPKGLVVADVPAETASLGGEEADDPDVAAEPLRAPEIDEPAPLSPEDAELARRTTASRPAPEPSLDVAFEPTDVPMPPALVGPSTASVRLLASRTAPKATTGATSADPMIEDLDQSLEMNRRAAARIRDAITRGGGGLGRALKGLRAEDLLVVKGTFDKMELVLDELRVPYVLASPADVARDDLRSRRFVFWNCMDPETALPARARPAILAHLREFVSRGGYLFTTDWGVANVVMLAFPGTLVTSGTQRTMPEMILEVTPKDPTHRLLDGVFPASGRVHWWLESASLDVMVVPGADVEVLVESRKLAATGRSPVVAATFRYGQGRVLHVMGHYYQQKGHVDGAAAAQRLALNFLREGLERAAASPSATTSR